ncbi:hypothetical protein PINS_up005650 [Pythium insidiosum]|nr:hypothetical protein PINS_up005650 [Pythium insidiosum]
MMHADSLMEDAGRLSSVAASVDVLLDERKMYTVTWRDASTFGFTVTPVNSDHGTVLQLARRTAKRSQLEAVGLQDVVPGDMLIAIGDERVYHLGAENATKYLRSVPKPVQLLMQLSPYGGAAKNLPDLAANEYNYHWQDGPLGLVLTYDPQSKLPMVKRLSDKANDVVRRDVQVGDQLIYANDVPSSEYSMDELMSILREMPKPIVMRFRKPLQNDHLVELPELADDEYEFLWEYGPLGLVIGQSRNGLPFVRAFTGKGTSPQLGLVQENDEIVMVNERSAVQDGFTETMNNLMHMPKPAVLRFRRAPVRRCTATSAAYQQHRRTMSRDDVKPPLPEAVGPVSPVGASAMSSRRDSLERTTENNAGGPARRWSRGSAGDKASNASTEAAGYTARRPSQPSNQFSPTNRSAMDRRSSASASTADGDNQFPAQQPTGPRRVSVADYSSSSSSTNDVPASLE